LSLIVLIPDDRSKSLTIAGELMYTRLVGYRLRFDDEA
jgi:hypothetical protein